MKKRGMSLITLVITVGVCVALARITIMFVGEEQIMDVAGPAIQDIQLINIQELANMAYYRIYTNNLTKGVRKEITAKEIRENMIKNGTEVLQLNKYNITVKDGDVFVTLKEEK